MIAQFCTICRTWILSFYISKRINTMKVTEFHAVSLGERRGEKEQGKHCVSLIPSKMFYCLCLLYKHYVYTLQDVLLRICLLYKHYILRLFIIQQPPVLGIFIFSPLKNSLSVGEMDLWLLLSGYLMHSSILEALFWEFCFPPFELGKRPMKSAVQSTPIHNWERFKTNKINNSNNNTFEKIINASLFAPYYIYEP